MVFGTPAERHDRDVVRAAIRVFDDRTKADWDPLTAFSAAVNEAERLGLSEEARASISRYAPIMTVIQEHRDTLTVRSFLRDPEDAGKAS